jgi:hypothetical protein
VPFHDFSGNSQSDSGTGIFFAGMQAFENLKDSIEMTLVDSDPIVADGEDPLGGSALGGDVNVGRGILLELDCVGNEILKHLGEQHGIADDDGQGIGGYLRPGLIDGGFEITDRILK